MFALVKKLFRIERAFSIKDAERLCIARAKAAGAFEYVTVDVGVWNRRVETAEEFGKRARQIVDAKYPSALQDPDLSVWEEGKLVLLIPLRAAGVVGKAMP
jgi:hypothetical protein